MSDFKDKKKDLDIDITFVDIPNEFILSKDNSQASEISIIDDGKNSKISKIRGTPIESDIDEGFGSYPEKFAHYENNSFFGEHLYETRKLEKKNINFVNDEIKNEENLLVFKKILKVFERHLNDINCPLNFLREIYISYLKIHYKIEPYFNLENNGKSKKKIDERNIINDIDCFISILSNLLLDFYQITSNIYLTSNRNLRNLFQFESFRYFLINSLFNIDSFYDIVHEAEKNKNFIKEQDFQNGIKKFPDLILKDFGVSKEFLLDECPLEPEKHQKIDYSSFNYNLAIDCIKNLQFIRSPVHKLKSVILCGLMIKKSIEDFYFKLYKRVSQDMIRPREFIRIMFFVVYKSKIPCMTSHLNMMQEFVHKKVLKGLKLPFFTYFKSSVEFFQQINDFLHQGQSFKDLLQEFLNNLD